MNGQAVNDRSAEAVGPHSFPRFTVLGTLGCDYDGTQVELGGPKQQMVLALLLLEANRVVPIERIVEWVWPESVDDPGSGVRRSTSTLQVYVSNLRRAFAFLGDQTLIVTRKPGYVINLSIDQLDALEFEQLKKTAESAIDVGDLEAARRQYRSAIGLWQGQCLSGLPIDVTDSGVITRLEAERIRSLEGLGEVELRLGRHSEVLPDLQHWVAATPFNEGLRSQLMLALYRCGRQADALTCYSEGRLILVEELGIDPSRQLRELEARILNQDPGLDYIESGATPGLDTFDEAVSTKLRNSIRPREAWIEMDGRRIPLKHQTTTIGRLSDRDLVVSDEGASRRHAEIRRTGDGYRLIDVGSSNRTHVNDAVVAEVQLCDGDIIRIGDTRIVFRSDSYNVRAPTPDSSERNSPG